MLTGFNEFISQILGLFQWWIVIAPWEAVIRVRRGNRTAVLAPGIHFRIPVLDRFFIQQSKKRYMNTPTQTVTTKDRQAVTVSGGTAYSVVDISVLYNSLSDADDVIQVETLALVAEYIAAHDLADVSPERIQAYVTEHLKLERYGLGDVSFLITDFVCVRTYRIINTNPKDWQVGGLQHTEKSIGKPK